MQLMDRHVRRAIFGGVMLMFLSVAGWAGDGTGSVRIQHVLCQEGVGRNGREPWRYDVRCPM